MLGTEPGTSTRAAGAPNHRAAVSTVQLESPAPKGKVVNSVGAGDSMVAGFLTGYLKSGKYEEAFHMGIAAGSASAFSERLATQEEVDGILGQMGWN